MYIYLAKFRNEVYIYILYNVPVVWSRRKIQIYRYLQVKYIMCLYIYQGAGSDVCVCVSILCLHPYFVCTFEYKRYILYKVSVGTCNDCYMGHT